MLTERHFFVVERFKMRLHHSQRIYKLFINMLLYISTLYRNEEFTCYVDQEIVKDLFHKTNLLTSSAKIQSSYVIRNVIERMTIEHIPRSQALEMTMYLKSSYPNTCVAETPDSRDASFDKRGGKNKKKSNVPTALSVSNKTETKDSKPKSKFAELVKENFNESVFLAKALNNEEEDKLRVLTIRSVDTKGE